MLRRLLVPGLILQGVVIGGGYATGRELVEYFLNYGLGGAFAGLTVVGLVWSVVFAAAFLFARVTASYDYGSFTKALLGPLQYAFDLVLVTLLLLIVAVMCAAAGEIVAEVTGRNALWGTIGLSLAVAAGLYLPSRLLASVIAFWSLVLYTAYGLLAFIVAREFGPAISAAVADATIEDGWFLSALKYSAYNLAALPAVLFIIPSLKSDFEAGVSGVLSGFIVLAPSFLIALILAGFMPGVLSAPVPLAVVLDALPNGALALFVQIAILGTFWQTSVGSLNAINERISVVLAPRVLPRWARSLIAFTFIGLALVLGVQFGVIALIAKGYAALTIGFFLLFIAPLLTIGLIKIITSKTSTPRPPSIDA